MGNGAFDGNAMRENLAAQAAARNPEQFGCLDLIAAGELQHLHKQLPLHASKPLGIQVL